MSEKYALIAAEKADPASPYPVVSMCAWLGISSSAFYDHLHAVESARQARRRLVARHVRATFQLHRGVYGARRVHAVLTHSTVPDVAGASLKLIRSIMREEGLVAVQKRAYKATTEQDPAATGHPADLLRRDFTAERPGTKLVGDITYIRTWAGWMYLATVIDCATRQVIGWSMNTHMRASLVCDALTMAATRTRLAPKAIFHSDRGTQYTSAEFHQCLTTHDLRASMGRRGQCWDNALAESFFGALKTELIYQRTFPTHESARRAIAEYIEVFYNQTRLHSALDYQTPNHVAHNLIKKNDNAA